MLNWIKAAMAASAVLLIAPAIANADTETPYERQYQKPSYYKGGSKPLPYKGTYRSVVSHYNWTGPYAGAHLGWGWGSSTIASCRTSPAARPTATCGRPPPTRHWRARAPTGWAGPPASASNTPSSATGLRRSNISTPISVRSTAPGPASRAPRPTPSASANTSLAQASTTSSPARSSADGDRASFDAVKVHSVAIEPRALAGPGLFLL